MGVDLVNASFQILDLSRFLCVGGGDLSVNTFVGPLQTVMLFSFRLLLVTFGTGWCDLLYANCYLNLECLQYV